MSENSSKNEPPSENENTHDSTTEEAVDVTVPPQPKPLMGLRIWPAIVLVALLWAIKLLLPYLGTSMPVLMTWFLGPLICAGLILLWWLFASRASVVEKLVGIMGVLALLAVTRALADPSMYVIGMMRYAIPFGVSGFALAAVGLSGWLSPKRTWVALAVAAVGFGYWDLLRMDEMLGDFRTVLNWRWQPTAEDKFLEDLAARSQNRQTAGAEGGAELGDAEWPGFRGPNRDGVQPGIVLEEDWSARPPKELWRVRVGPGWSSFAVAGNRLFTQEQRGEDEVVVCYDAESGQEIWAYKDQTRFWEAMGGAGPRATPTIADGKLFALGATGLLNRLDPISGEQIWQQDIGEIADRKPPTWGYSSSPLVTGETVIVYAGGEDQKGLLAFDTESGELRWSAPAKSADDYSSPQLSVIDGQACVLMVTREGLIIVHPDDGGVLGRYEWEHQGYRVTQPLVVGESSVLVSTGLRIGTRRIQLKRDSRSFQGEESWTSRGLSPDFNDSVAHNGYLYGFDNNIFACVDLETGKRQWKRGRYGNGQALLLPDGNQLLVLAEKGDLILLRANPEKLDERGRHAVLSGRTWNHPVLVGERLYVRNSEEAACFEVPTAQPALQ